MLNLVTNGECNIKRYKKLQNWTKGTSKSVKLIEKLSGSPPLLRGTTSALSKIKFFNFLKFKKYFSSNIDDVYSVLFEGAHRPLKVG